MGAAVVLTPGVAATPRSFELVFHGHHGAPLGVGLQHVGPFTSSAPFCRSGTVVDVRHDTEDSATRLHTCDDGSGTLTVFVTRFPDEHVSGGNGTWRITGGTGAYATLRGFGTWTTVPLTGEDQPFRSTLTGIADLDAEAPNVTISSLRATRLKRPAGTYVLRVVFSAVDAGNTVSYRVVASADISSWARTGTTSGKAAVTLRIRVPKARAILIQITATDPVQNDRTVSRVLRLPRKR